MEPDGEADGEADGGVRTEGDAEGLAGEGVLLGSDTAGDLVLVGDGEGEAELEAAPEPLGAGFPEATAAVLPSTTVVMVRASVVKTLVLKNVLPERDDDVAKRDAMMRQFDEGAEYVLLRKIVNGDEKGPYG